MGIEGLWGLRLCLEEMLIVTHISLAGAGHMAAPVPGVLGDRGLSADPTLGISHPLPITVRTGDELCSPRVFSRW